MDGKALARQMDLAGCEPRPDLLARWTENTQSTEDEFEAYGDFVDEHGRVWSGSHPARAWLESINPQDLVSTVPRPPQPHALVFLDWARQDLPWSEVIKLWDSWVDQGIVLDCGGVALSPSCMNHWGFPGWVLFANGFDGAPLQTTAITVPEERPLVEDKPASVSPQPRSFLARAETLRPRLPNAAPGEPVPLLPLIPFTLETLNNSQADGPWSVLPG